MIFKKLNVAVTIFFLNSFKTLREIFFSYFFGRMKVSPCTQVIVMVLTLGLLCEVHAQNYHFSNGWQPGKRSYRGCTVRPEIRSILFKIIEVNTKSFFIIWTFAQNRPVIKFNKIVNYKVFNYKYVLVVYKLMLDWWIWLWLAWKIYF